ncbi:MAG: DUF4139 domain-containing protein [Gemmatimonadota bacterium]|nr:MAG: DUF4139 domain-containing protein [Gemmatimonadota bacterium]
MVMLRSGLLGGLALAVMLPLGAVSVGGGGTGTTGPSLTIYTGNLALARQEVERTLEPGAHTVRVDGLPTNIDASSLIVLNDGATLQGVHGQRNYQDPASGPGTSLELDLEVQRRVERLELAYLTTGLNWSASYALVVARDDASARVDGYATVANNSGTSYEEAEVQLLAGTIQRGRGRFEPAAPLRAEAFEEMAAAPELQEAAFADYHVYTVSTPLTLRAGESRRIRLLGAGSVRTRKEYTFSHSANYYRQSPEPLTQPVVISYRIERGEESEFGGVPLPGGQVRLLQRDEVGRIQLLGIATIPNTPRGEDLRLVTGHAFDIVGTRTQTDYERPAGNVYESGWKVEVRNRSGSDVTVQVIEQLSGDWSIVESSQRWEKLSAGAVRFFLDVPAGGESVLEYRVSVRT